MSAPERYGISYDFTAFQAAHPSSPLPADKLEIELGNLQTTTDQIIDNLGLIQRADGQLANDSVGLNQLQDEVLAALNIAAGDESSIDDALLNDVVTVTPTNSVITLDLATRRVFKHTTTENITFIFSNPPVTGTRCVFEIHIFQGATGRNITLPVNVKWSRGVAPTINIANTDYMLSIYTIDGGVSYVAMLAAEAIS